MTEQSAQPATTHRQKVVIIGSGFGGLFAVKKLADAPVDIVLIDRGNHHLFQPLLYQVATGLLAAGDIAPQTRHILRKQRNARVIVGEVTDLDLEAQTVTSQHGEQVTVTAYDHIIVAAGAGQSYFGNDHFAEFAPGMKTIDDALEIRARIVDAFERAELAEDAAERDRQLTFTVIGAGPTGVELAGQIAEMAHRTMAESFRRIDPSSAKILLIDGAPQVLPPFGPNLGRYTKKKLESLGVTVVLDAMVTNVDAAGLTYKFKDGSEETVASACKIWSAGVSASPLGRMIAEQAGIETDRAGRVLVNEDLTAGGFSNVFVVGDMMNLNNLPGVAQVAIQGGQYAANQIIREVAGTQSSSAREPFEYFDKGSMATVSRFSAVVKMGKVEVTGFIGWVLWLAIHLMYLVGFKNQASAVLAWGMNVLSKGRSQMPTTSQQLNARTALDKLTQTALETGETPREVIETRVGFLARARKALSAK